MEYSFAPAEEIGQYFISVAKAHNLHQDIEFNSCVVSARWDDRKARWLVQVVEAGSGEGGMVDSKEHEADVFINAGGILNDWKWPDIPGLDVFKGRKVHTAAWVRVTLIIAYNHPQEPSRRIPN